MTRNQRFNIVVSEEERNLIAAVAERLERSAADTIRLLVRGVAQELGVTTDKGPSVRQGVGACETGTDDIP
jgi:hypothetical protein